MNLLSKKFTVNQEKIPSSVPSIIETEFSSVKNGDSLKSSLTSLSKFSAFSSGSKRRPAVALSVRGVLLQYGSGISFFALSNSVLIDAAPLKY